MISKSAACTSSWLRQVIKGVTHSRVIVWSSMRNKVRRRIMVIPITRGILLLGSDLNMSSVICSEILTDIRLVNFAATISTLVAIRALTFTVEDITTLTHEAADTKLLQGLERIETKSTAGTFRDWLISWDCSPPPFEALGAAELLEFTACFQIVLSQCSLRQRRAVLTLSFNLSLFLNTDFLIGFMGIRYGVFCPAFYLYEYA